MISILKYVKEIIRKDNKDGKVKASKYICTGGFILRYIMNTIHFKAGAFVMYITD